MGSGGDSVVAMVATVVISGDNCGSGYMATVVISGDNGSSGYMAAVVIVVT